MFIYDHHGVKEEKEYIKSVKVRELRSQIENSFTMQLYNMIDVEDFVKREIETKGIIVIDEIDKLASPVKTLFMMIID